MESERLVGNECWDFQSEFNFVDNYVCKPKLFTFKEDIGRMGFYVATLGVLGYLFLETEYPGIVSDFVEGLVR